ncbi:hypothetical protein B296_00051282, partial [Ensete ventricosum]
EHTGIRDVNGCSLKPKHLNITLARHPGRRRGGRRCRGRGRGCPSGRGSRGHSPAASNPSERTGAPSVALLQPPSLPPPCAASALRDGDVRLIERKGERPRCFAPTTSLLPCNGIIRSPSSSTKSSISVSLTEAGPTGTDSTVDFWGGVSKRVHLVHRSSCPPARAPCSGAPNLDQTQKNTRSILLLRESRGPMWAAGSVIDADAPSTCFT